MKAGWQSGDVLLCLDWTLLRLFPPLRATWALTGTQAVVPITGANAKRVLFGAIDLRTAHRIVLIRRHAGQADAQVFLSELRRHYRRAGQIWLLADRASAHTAPQTLAVAARLRIRFLWLPKQTPELSPMDQLWRELKRLIAANRQAESIDALADDAAEWLLTLTPQTLAVAARLRIRFLWLPKQAPELSPMDQLWRELKRLIAANRQAESIDTLADDAAEWLLTLTPQQARRKAAMTSKRFWLKRLLQHFRPPT